MKFKLMFTCKYCNKAKPIMEFNYPDHVINPPKFFVGVCDCTRGKCITGGDKLLEHFDEHVIPPCYLLL